MPSNNERIPRYLLFLRHGEAPNDPNIFLSDYKKPLSHHGQRQAEIASSVVDAFRPDCIYCSPFLRTRMTAELACKNLKQPIQMSEGIIERAFPMLYDMTREQIISAFSKNVLYDLCHQSDHIQIPGSETLEEGQRRVVQEVEEMLKTPSKRILVISHGGPHSWLCCHYASLDLSKIRLFTLHEGNFSLFQFTDEGNFEKFISLNSSALHKKF